MTNIMDDTHATANPADAEEMKKYGIVRVPADYFHYGKFRYTNLKDAVAQARREQALGRTA